MRKLLLASVAVLGAASAAQAQVNMNAAPAPNVPGVNAAANSMPALAPGQIVVRMNGRFNWYAGFIADGDSNAAYWTNSATAPTSSAWFATLTSGTGSSAVTLTNQRPSFFNSIRLQPTGVGGGGFAASGSNSVMIRAKNNQGASFASYIRLYPGFDGMAANGLRYGVAAEIRQDNGGRSGGGAAGTISQQNNVRSALYWRRAYGYVAGDSWGTLRFGSGDGPATLFMTGNFENMNDAGWNGDLPSMLAGGGPAWPFADVGTVYGTNKIVYLSPQFAGFDVGLTWAPTSNSLSNNNGCALTAASVGCDRLFSIDGSSSTTEQQRQHDFFEAMARYRGTFGGVGISAYGGWFGSTSINTNNALFTTPRASIEFKNNSIGVGGAQISYAGFAVGGMVQGGDYNRGFAPAPKGTDGSLAWLVGASYTTGPIIVGGHYWEHTTPGSFVPGGAQQSTPFVNSTFFVGKEQKERGLALGGTYAVAPGFSLFLSYIWGDRHQDGVNLLTGERATGRSSTTFSNTTNAGGLFKNTITVQAVSVGTQLRW